MTIGMTTDLRTDLLHPEDVLYFAEVAVAMRRVATKRGLRLRSVGHLPDSHIGFCTDRWGDCDSEGNVRLLVRAKESGQWQGRLSPEEVWRVAAHELAHLVHLDHSVAHRELTDDLFFELSNVQEDHRQKILKKLVKMQAQKDSEAKIGNVEAADAFARMINRMLLDYELRPTDVDYAWAGEDDPVLQVEFDQPRYGLKVKGARSAWREYLARVVADAHLCTTLVRPGSNRTWFVGTRSHATVAEYAFGVLVSAAEKMAEAEYDWYYKQLKYKEGKEVRGGFKGSWLQGFITRIGQRFCEERDRAVEEARSRAVEVGGDPGVALMRLDGAVAKVRKYVDANFRGHASPVGVHYRDHKEGRERGRKAADRMVLEQKGITGPASVRGLLEEVSA